MGGRLFHRRGAEEEKALSPVRVRVLGPETGLPFGMHGVSLPPSPLGSLTDSGEAEKQGI